MPRKKQKYETLECFICHKRFGRKMYNLRRHSALHGPFLKKSKCPTCGKTFQNKANYKTHWLQIHAGNQKIMRAPVEVPAKAKRKTWNHLKR